MLSVLRTCFPLTSLMAVVFSKLTLVLLPQTSFFIFCESHSVYRFIFLNMADCQPLQTVEVDPVKNNIHRYIKRDKIYNQTIMFKLKISWYLPL